MPTIAVPALDPTHARPHENNALHIVRTELIQQRSTGRWSTGCIHQWLVLLHSTKIDQPDRQCTVSTCPCRCTAQENNLCTPLSGHRRRHADQESTIGTPAAPILRHQRSRRYRMCRSDTFRKLFVLASFEIGLTGSCCSLLPGHCLKLSHTYLPRMEYSPRW